MKMIPMDKLKNQNMHTLMMLPQFYTTGLANDCFLTLLSLGQAAKSHKLHCIQIPNVTCKFL
jgi:hypothetical protein